jgi:hypothetical protein
MIYAIIRKRRTCAGNQSDLLSRFLAGRDKDDGRVTFIRC